MSKIKEERWSLIYDRWTSIICKYNISILTEFLSGHILIVKQRERRAEQTETWLRTKQKMTQLFQLLSFLPLKDISFDRSAALRQLQHLSIRVRPGNPPRRLPVYITFCCCIHLFFDSSFVFLTIAFSPCVNNLVNMRKR